MRKTVVVALVLLVGFVFGMIGDRALNAQQASVKRTVLLKHDIAGYASREGVVVEAEIGLASQSGWHHHPGEEYSYIMEGEGMLQIQGQQPLALKPGVVGHIDDAVPHNAENTGATPLRILVFYVVDKGKPLAIPDNPPQ